MPIIYFEGIKPPCNFTDTQPLVLHGEERYVMIINSGLRLPHWTFAFVRNRRGSKEKNYWEGSQQLLISGKGGRQLEREGIVRVKRGIDQSRFLPYYSMFYSNTIC